MDGLSSLKPPEPEVPEQELLDSLVSVVQETIKPVGWKAIVAIQRFENKTAGGVIMPDELVDRETVANVRAYVCGLGPLCFQQDRFKGERLFEVGDWVSIKPYAGTRIGVETLPGIELRLINDDMVEAVILKPEDVRRR